jgi:hypothetical protein
MGVKPKNLKTNRQKCSFWAVIGLHYISAISQQSVEFLRVLWAVRVAALVIQNEKLSGSHCLELAGFRCLHSSIFWL